VRIMDLIFPQNLKASTLSSKACSRPSSSSSSSSRLFFPCPQRSFKCWPSRILTPASKLKQVRIRSEFEGKVNGALSADFDPRFLDRVCCSFLFFFTSALQLYLLHIMHAYGFSSIEAFHLLGPICCFPLTFSLMALEMHYWEA
jgi:hypothetical protein